MALKLYTLVSLIGLSSLMYILPDLYVLNYDISIFTGTNSGIMTKCEDAYPDTYFRKRIYDANFTYYVYAIQIGQIFTQSQSLSPEQISEYDIQLQNDSLVNMVWLNKSDDESVSMRKLYRLYYHEFHKNRIVHCPYSSDHIDFFEFIQHQTPVQHNHTISFYDGLLIKDILHYHNHSKRYIANLTKHERHNLLRSGYEYKQPRLYSYTLSMQKKKQLSTLEFRFAEINEAYQHQQVKHLLMNGVKNHLLWSGEMYYYFDYKYKKYVLIMDNASGHYKPNITLKPEYLEDILLKSLFPTDMNDDNKSEYKPVKVIGYQSKPWHRLKKRMFPYLSEISRVDGIINRQKKAEWKEMWAAYREKLKQNRLKNKKKKRIIRHGYRKKAVNK